jgi:hypothetical protein
MKRRAIIFAPVLMAWLLVTVLALAATVYHDAVNGFESASSESEGVKLLLNAEGDLPGVNSMVLRRDGNKVIGGSWTMTVMPPDAGPTTNEKGKLTGSVDGGALTFNGDGALTNAQSVQLTIQSGTGHYSGVKSGSGVVNLSPRAENPSQLAGTLVLNF